MLSVKDNNHFLRAYKKGRYIHGGFVTLHFVRNDLDEVRLGITVSKKIGCAVVRNRCKRIIRAAVFPRASQFPPGYDLVFIVREGLRDKKSTDVADFLDNRALPYISRCTSGNR
jgi:ribonuclease P protein component